VIAVVAVAVATAFLRRVRETVLSMAECETALWMFVWETAFSMAEWETALLVFE